MKKCPPHVKDKRLLEQQLSEIIKNAVIHGNKSNIKKKVRIWYEFTNQHIRIIIKDEGKGFTELEKWNEFYEEREKAFSSGDFENMEKYVSWRGKDAGADDGGNSLFAAVEFWDGGIIYNAKKNKVVAVRYLTKVN